MDQPDRLLSPFTCHIRVRYAETDAAGVVYYANYLVYFEVARVELLRALGCSVTEVEAQGLLLPAVDAHVRYVRPAHLDDLLAVGARVTRPGRASFGFTYEVRRDGELIAEGSTRHAAVDRVTGKAVPLPPWMRGLLARVGDSPAEME